MNLKERIEKDFLEAYKAKREMEISVLRLIKSAVKNAEINLKKELSDDDIIKVFKREIKQRQDSIDFYEKGGRDELAAKEESEIALIENYLPKQLPEEEIEKIVNDTVAETGASEMKDMGTVMAAVMAKVGSKADGATVSRLVKDALQQ